MKTPNGLSPKSKKIWKGIEKKYSLLEPDFPLFELALESRDEWQKLKKKIEKEGYAITTKTGQMKAHPLLKAMNDAKTSFIRAWRALGFETGEPRGIGRPPEGMGIGMKGDDDECL